MLGLGWWDEHSRLLCLGRFFVKLLNLNKGVQTGMLLASCVDAFGPRINGSDHHNRWMELRW